MVLVSEIMTFVVVLIAIVTLASGEFLAGGKQKVDVSDPHVQRAAKVAVGKLDQMSNTMFRAKLIRVTNAETQVVAGKLYHLTMELGITGCRKGDNSVRLESCQSKRLQKCQVKVWEKQWEQFMEVTDFSCGPFEALNGRTRRSVDPDFLYSTLHANQLRNDKRQQEKELFSAFVDFKQNFNRRYESLDEEIHRYYTFKDNMKIAAALQHNEQGTATYGANQFADWTADEFRKILNPGMHEDPTMTQAQIPKEDPPSSFDWRQHDAVTEVKNQGQCGSCWAFSTTGNIEGQWAIKKKKLVSLSEQELVDCDKVDEGCNGGLPSQAYKEIIRLGGLETEAEYPYKGEGEKCVFNKKDASVYINSSVAISKDEKDMAAWLAKNGPISIGINAFAMQFYMGGISHPWKIFCSPSELDHGVLIVGYGTEGSTPFWIVKNSWGPGWGEKGYYRVYRGDGTCGLNQMCTSAVIN